MRWLVVERRAMIARVGLALAFTIGLASCGRIGFDPIAGHWDFSIPNEYTYDPASIAITGGLARLAALDQVDDAGDAAGFGGASLRNAAWSAADGWLAATPAVPLPDLGATTGVVDLTGNVLLFHMDEASWSASPGQVADSSGAGHAGTASGGATTGATARFGRAADLTGSTFVRIPNHPDLDATGGVMTVMAWVHASPSGALQVIYGFGSAANGPALAVAANGHLQASSATSGTVDAGIVAADGTWHHVAAVWTGGSVALYVDGGLAASGAGVFADEPTLENQVGARCAGASSTSCNSFFVGQLDDVAVFRRALASEEVAAAAGRGVITSRVLDAGAPVAWTSLAWVTPWPTGKPLQGGQAVETAYERGNVDMTGNVVLLHLDESAWTGAAGEVVDASGAGHPGTALGGIAANGLGVFGGDGAFAGTDGRVELPTSADLDGPSGTFAAWFRSSTTQNNFDERVIFVRGQHSDRPYNGMILQLSGTTPGTVHFTNINATGGTDTTGMIDTSCPFRVDDGRWHHVALTYDRASNGTNTVYLDGQVCGTGHSQAGLSYGGDPIDIGFFPGVGTNVGYDGPFVGAIDEVALWNRQLSATEIADLYRRGAEVAAFQVRTGATADCADGVWRGPDGTAATVYTEADASQLGLPVIAPGLPQARCFQYRAVLVPDGAVASPPLRSVSIGPDHVFAGGPSVGNVIGDPFEVLSGFTETLGAGNAGVVRHQISNDGSTWHYWDGAAWSVATAPEQSSPAADVDAHLASFSSEVGPGTFYFRAFLESDGSQPVALDEIDVR